MSEIATQIYDILQEIRLGSIENIIHEGKVVQIERKQKLRFCRGEFIRPWADKSAYTRNSRPTGSPDGTGFFED